MNQFTWTGHHWLLYTIILLYLPFWAIALEKFRDFHHGLSKRELHHTFGVEDAADVPEYAVFARPQKDARLLRFAAGGESFEIHLEPQDHRLLSQNLISIVRDGSSSRLDPPGRLFEEQRSCHFRGIVVSHNDAPAAISHCDSLRGSLHLGDDFVVVGPLPRRLRDWDAASDAHVVYKRSAGLSAAEAGLGLDAGLLSMLRKAPVQEELQYKTLEEYSEFCDVSATAGGLYRDAVANYTVPQIARRDSLYVFPNTDPLELEMALFLDAPLWEYFREEFGPERAERELVEFSLALMNNVHILYQQTTLTPNIRITLVRYELWKSQPTRLASRVHKSGQAQLLLDAFCQHQADLNPGTDSDDAGHWDHAVMLTGYDLYHTTSSVAGVAPVARMCDQQFTCSLVEGRHLGRSFVLAHEMGHNLGMVHDGVQNLCSRSCCLMSAVNGAGKTTWSPCSVRELNAYILSLGEPGAPPNCLTDAAQGLRDRSHRADGRLPGQRFTADQQCAFFWGRDYRQEIPTGRSLSDICHILWCGNSGSTISTAHPALEGTWCGGQRWCSAGVCSGWAASERPAVVDGGWSAWARDSETLCSECKLRGALRLRTQGRFCDSPSPNNGGSYCTGTNVRGLVCGGVDTCTNGFSKQAFGDNLCASFLNDRHAPDTQLSGRSYLHPTSTCKIWCHLGGSDLIRNKARFPDGSPCDGGGFCVSGECMRLACDSEAIVADDSDCPLQARSLRSRGSWSGWGAWSSCSATCGTGSVRRTRRCPITQNCGPEEREETAPCSEAACADWGAWGSWAACDASCGATGSRRRSRTCAAGIGCPGSSLDVSGCPSLPSCPRGGRWSVWGGWGVCSASCGGGKRRRRRRCKGGRCEGGQSDELGPCESQICPSWSLWSGWGVCSRSCNSGKQRRRRVCVGGPGCPGITNQDQFCNRQACPSYSEWSVWSDCSVSCGGGVKRRDRSCNTAQCFGSSFQEEGCHHETCVGPGGFGWASWALWSECSRSCGLGLTNRIRRCEAPRFSDCFGESDQTKTCNVQVHKAFVRLVLSLPYSNKHTHNHNYVCHNGYNKATGVGAVSFCVCLSLAVYDGFHQRAQCDWVG